MKARILKSVFIPYRPVHLILHITNRCTLRCKTCFVTFDDVPDRELNLEEINGIAKCLKKLIWLDISGGEPFLRSDLPDICAAFDAKTIAIPTNGFDPPLICETTKKIREGVSSEINISISIDGFEPINDEIRGRGYFKKSIETVELLKRVPGIRIKVNTVLCNKNYAEIIDFMKFVKGLGVDFQSVIFRRGSKVVAKPFECPPYEELKRIKAEIFRIWGTYDYGFGAFESRILHNYQRAMYEASLRVIKEKKQVMRCLAGRRHLVIYADGSVSFCEVLPPFGNIRNERLPSLLKSKNAEKSRDLIAGRGCYCYHNCNMIDNFFLNPLYYPRFLIG